MVAPSLRMTVGSAGLFQFRRRAFTLVELLVVIILLLVLVGVTIPLALRVTQGDRVRSAADTVQIALATARDRASARGLPIGIRLVPDDQDRSLVRSVVYIRQGQPISGDPVGGRASALVMHGPAQLFDSSGALVATGSKEWPAPLTSAADLEQAVFGAVVLIGVDPARLLRLPSFVRNNQQYYYGAIRLENAGPIRPFVATPASIGYRVDTGGGVFVENPVLYLTEPLAMPVPWGTTINPTTDPTLGPVDLVYTRTWFDAATYARLGDNFIIHVGNERTEDDPIQLPAGTLIDLGYLDPNPNVPPDPPELRLSRIRPDLAGNWDILVSPSGQVVGSSAADPQVILWVREQLGGIETVNVKAAGGSSVTPTGFQKLVRTNGTGRHVLVTIFSRTGFVQTSDPLFEDLRNSTNPAVTTPDGYYDQQSYYNTVPKGAGTGL
jgi:prepilin-type N-terminal cleavage/methylation domain-containing protein